MPEGLPSVDPAAAALLDPTSAAQMSPDQLASFNAQVAPVPKSQDVFLDPGSFSRMSIDQLQSFKSQLPEGTNIQVGSPKAATPPANAPPDIDPDAVKQMTPVQLAKFFNQTKTSPYDWAQQHPELLDDNNRDKLGATDLEIRKRGWAFKDIPIGTVVGALPALAKGLWRYGELVKSEVLGAGTPEGTKAGGESLAATETAAMGMADLVRRSYNKAGRFLHLQKQYDDYTPEDARNLFDNELSIRNQMAQVTSGEGESTKFLGGEVLRELKATGVKLNPETIAEASAGDPLTFAAFSGGFKVINAATGKVLGFAANRSAALQTIARLKAIRGPVAAAEKTAQEIPTAENLSRSFQATIAQGAERASAGPMLSGIESGTAIGADAVQSLNEVPGIAIGRTLQGAGAAVQGITQALGKFGKYGVIGELAHGNFPAAAATIAADLVKAPIQRAGAALQTLGKTVAEGAAPGGTWARAVEDLAKIPGQAIGGAAKAFPIDFGLMSLSADTPEEAKQSPFMATAFGAAHGLLLGGGGFVRGQTLAPRPWATSAAATKSYGNFPALDAAHSATMKIADPGVARRVGALRDLASTVGAEVYQFSGEADLAKFFESQGYSSEDAQATAQQSGVMLGNLPDKNGDPRKVLLIRDPHSAPHEVAHPLMDAMTQEQQTAFFAALEKSLGGTDEVLARAQREAGQIAQGSPEWQAEATVTPDSWKNFLLRVTGDGPKAASEKILGDPSLEGKPWDLALTDPEKTELVKRYALNEIGADSIAAVLKHTGSGLAKDSGVLGVTARTLARLFTFLGADPYAGVTEGTGRTPVTGQTLEAAKAAVQPFAVEARQGEAAAKPSPELPRKPVSAVPGTPADEAKVTEELSRTAPEIPTGPEVDAQSPREILGVFAESKASGQGVKITRRSAPGTPAGALEISRGKRRMQIERARSIPDDQKPLWEKNFTPVKTVQLKDGSLQEQGWSPEVLAANAEKTAGFLAKTDPSLSPFAIDTAKGSFTPAGWKDLFDKVRTYAANQAAGLTGKGGPIEIGKASALGFYEPTGNRMAAGTLTPAEENFINYLFGVPLPGEGKSTLARGGKAQFGHQLISEATEPGRAQPLVEPRTFESKQAKDLGFAGEQLLEVNPLRAQIEALGRNDVRLPAPSPIEVWQNLNVRDVIKAEIAPELPAVRPNLTTIRAGFQPMPANPKAIKSAAVRDESGRIFEGTWHGDAFMKAQSSPGERGRLEEGFVANDTSWYSREEAAQVAEEIGQLPAQTDQGLQSETFESQRAFQPKQEDEIRLGKTFDTFIEGARAAIQDGYPDLAQGFLERAAGAANFQRTLARKGDVSEFGDPEIDKEHEAQIATIQGMRDALTQSKKENTIFLDPNLAAKVFEAGGRLKEHPPQQSMEGTGFKSNVELVEKYFADHKQPGWYPTFYGADRTENKWKETQIRLAAEIADSPNPIATLNAMDAEMKSAGRGEHFKSEIIKRISEFEGIKNQRRILAGYFGKRAPFSQIRKPGPTKFQPKSTVPRAIKSAAAREKETGRIFEGSAHFITDQLAREAGATGHLEDGFVTNDGEFLDREQAHKRALELQQIKAFPGDNELMSETRRAFQPAEERKEIELIGPDGKTYKALFDGYQDATMLGLGHVPQITPLEDLPGSVLKNSTTYGPSLTKAGYKLPELPEAKFQPKRLEEVDKLAREYAKIAGFNYVPPEGYVQYPRETAKKLAKFYEDALHSPDDPEVKASYDAFKQETLAQWKAIEDAGYDLEPVISAESLYKSGAAVAKDVEENKHLFFNLSESAFGQEGQSEIQSMLELAGVSAKGRDLNFNDIFRAVHDFFGHAKESLSFGPRGEFNAWREHATLYSPEAQGALAAETIGQTAWTQIKPSLLNPATGELLKPGESGFIARAERPYAEQKNIIVPQKLIDEARGIKFSPKKREADPLKFLGTAHGNASKAWILPNGKVEQLGAQWHHEFLADNPELQKRYGLKLPPFEGGDTEGIRESAVRKGFARVNLQNATLTVEARQKDWKNLRPIVEDLIERNLDDIDRFRVGLLNDTATDLKKTYSEKLFDADTDKEKMARVYGSFSETPQAEIGRETKFQPMPRNPKAIKSVAVKDEETGQVYEGVMHATIYAELAKQPGFDADSAVLTDGFVTNSGEFLDREQALDRAVELGQMSKRKLPNLAKRMGALESKEFAGARKFQPPTREDFENPETLKDALESPGWAIITATQEAIGPWTDPKNIAANEALESDLNDKGYEYLPIAGTYKGEAQGKNFLVTGISTYDAQALGKKYGQESVLTPKGLLYGNGTITPSRPEDTAIGKQAAAEDFYSTLPNGMHFSIPLDFDKPYKPVVEQSTLFGGRGYVSPAQLTQVELRNRYPEAIVPKNSNEKIASDIVGSPLYKKSADPVNAFAEKLVEFARQYSDNPIYQLGLKWYSDFTPLLKKHFGKDAPMMAELLAASSPNETPTQNFYYAVDALEGFRSGRFDKIIEKFNQGFDLYKSDAWLGWYNRELNAGNMPKPPASPTPEAFLAHWVYKHNLKPKQSNGQLYGFHGRAILEVMARKWLAENQGPKVANFVQNLLGSGHEATIDVWADRTMRRLGYGDFKARWRILPTNGEGVSDADFAFSQEAFRAAAKTLGVPPDALQGGLWWAEKILWSDNGWSRLDLGSYVKEIEKLPMIKQAIKHRLGTTKLKEKTRPAQNFELELRPSK